MVTISGIYLSRSWREKGERRERECREREKPQERTMTLQAEMQKPKNSREVQKFVDFDGGKSQSLGSSNIKA